MTRSGNVHRCGHLAFVPVAHRHEALELNLIVAGKATYLIDGSRYELSARHVLFLFPSQEHVLVDTSLDHRAFVAHAGAPFVREMCFSPKTRVLAERDAPLRFASLLPTSSARKLETTLRALADEVRDDAQFNAGLAYALTSAWLLHLEAQAVLPRASPDALVARAIALLASEGDVPLDALARKLGVSRSVLTRKFKEQTSVSVVGYRNRLRVERFVAAFGEGSEQSMLDAALSAGFGSYAQFHRVFRAVMGKAPQAWKRGGICP